MSTFQNKALISAQAALFYALVNTRFTYELTDRLLPFNTFDYLTGCPTNFGLLIHTFVFFLITYFSMGGSTRSSTKLKNSLFGTLIFFFVSSPVVYSFVGSLLGPNFADANGCPTNAGVLVHAFVYFLVLLAIMYVV